jgi:hypothetical protein
MSHTALESLASCGDHRLQVIEAEQQSDCEWFLCDRATGQRITIWPQHVSALNAHLRSLLDCLEKYELTDEIQRSVPDGYCLDGRLEFHRYVAYNDIFWTLTDMDTDMSVRIQADELAEVCSMLESFKQRCL